jgi:putative nucleotidyltransferase with HDIG domain
MTSADRARFEAHLLSPRVAELLRVDLARGAWLDRLIPEIRIEMDFLQRTRYHAHTNLEHSLRVTAGVPGVLDERLAALFHDIGKRRTVSIKERNGDEQYLGHAEEGARMARPILTRLGYPKELVDRVTSRIWWHMELHTAANNGGSAKAQAKLLGKIEADLPALERLQIADIEAMNPKLVQAMKASALGYHRLLAQTIAARDSVRTTDCSKPRGQGKFSVPAALAAADRPPRESSRPARIAGRRESPDEILQRYRRGAQRREHPALVVVAGLPASGKTYLAERLANEADFRRVSSDDIRMALTGNAPDYHNRGEILTCFATVRRIVEALLAAGERVVVDSTARVPSERRESIALGRAAGVPVVLLWCKVDDETAAARLTRRALARDAADRSEADAAVRARMAQNATPPSPHEADLVMTWTPPIEAGVWGKLMSFVKE